MDKDKKRDAFPLKVTAITGNCIRKLAKVNRRKINEELTIAIEEYIDKNKKLLK